MPLQVDDPNGVAPKEAHLALITSEAGDAIAFGRGNRLVLVDGHTKVPLVLVKVSLKELVFRCACRSPGCTAIYTFRASRTGHHPKR